MYLEWTEMSGVSASIRGLIAKQRGPCSRHHHGGNGHNHAGVGWMSAQRGFSKTASNNDTPLNGTPIGKIASIKMDVYFGQISAIMEEYVLVGM